VDGVTKSEYGEDLEQKLVDLRMRLRSKRWRHQPIRRVHIPKGPGKTRPIGISTIEDKIVQDSARELLEAIYEQDFLDCSYGFRPGRRAHDALRSLNRSVHSGEANWIIEAAHKTRGVTAIVIVSKSTVEDCPYADPYYWAPFVLFGDPN
jgi:retron-type reverse transcriptase